MTEVTFLRGAFNDNVYNWGWKMEENAAEISVIFPVSPGRDFLDQILRKGGILSFRSKKNIRCYISRKSPPKEFLLEVIQKKVTYFRIGREMERSFWLKIGERRVLIAVENTSDKEARQYSLWQLSKEDLIVKVNDLTKITLADALKGITASTKNLKVISDGKWQRIFQPVVELYL